MDGQIDPEEQLRVITWAPDYMVSDRGNVYRIVNENGTLRLQPRKAYLAKVGYYVVTISGGVRKSWPRYIHRLVAEAFLPPPGENHEVRHLDGDRLNNRAANLAWGTRRQNIEDTIRHGRLRRGESLPFAKLTETDVLVIRYLFRRGASAYAVASLFKLTHTAATDVRDGRTWRHVPDRLLSEALDDPRECDPEHRLGEGVL